MGVTEEIHHTSEPTTAVGGGKRSITKGSEKPQTRPPDLDFGPSGRIESILR
jgi:hypothetical protein